MEAEETSAKLAALGAATVYEAAGRHGALDPRIRLLTGSRLVGRALPVKCHPGDNLAVHRAVAAADSGDILVVDGGGVAVGYIGDILGESALVRGVPGAVVDGGVRDLDALAELGFSVWARGPSICGATKVTPGELGEPVICGAVSIAHGDWIVADVDGVVAVPAEGLASTLEAAAHRAAEEERVRARLRQGELTLDVLDLRADTATGPVDSRTTSSPERL